MTPAERLREAVTIYRINPSTEIATYLAQCADELLLELGE